VQISVRMYYKHIMPSLLGSFPLFLSLLIVSIRFRFGFSDSVCTNFNCFDGNDPSTPSNMTTFTTDNSRDGNARTLTLTFCFGCLANVSCPGVLAELHPKFAFGQSFTVRNFRTFNWSKQATFSATKREHLSVMTRFSATLPILAPVLAWFFHGQGSASVFTAQDLPSYGRRV